MRRALPGHFKASLSPHDGIYGVGDCVPIDPDWAARGYPSLPPSIGCGSCANCAHCSSCGGEMPVGYFNLGPSRERIAPVLPTPIGQLLEEEELDRLIWDFDRMAWYDPETGAFYETKYEASGAEYPGRTEISPASEYLETLREEERFEGSRAKPQYVLPLLAIVGALFIWGESRPVGTGWFGK